jgi:hypothetical protein
MWGRKGGKIKKLISFFKKEKPPEGMGGGIIFS